MKMKILLGSIVAILILGLAGGAFWWLRRPQVITFSNGDKLTLLAVDYGKKHVPPATKTTTARGARATSFNTPTDTLVLWVRQEHEPNQYAYFQYYVYDKANTACVESYGNGGSQQAASSVMSVQLPAFPRRQGKFIVRVQEQGNGGQEMSDEKFVIANPARGPLKSWSAEPLPAAKDDDDLSVTMTKLVFGADSNVNRNQDNPDDPMNKGVQATFNVSYKGKPVANWQPVAIETSDATGNHINGNVSQNQWQENDDLVTYQWGLWADEPAWKLKAEFSKQSGYDDDELWTVKNIPLVAGRQQDFWNFGNRRGQTNATTAFAETDLNGVHLKIFPATQFTDQNMGNGQMSGGLHIEAAPSLPAGMRLTFIKLTDEQGGDIQNYNSGSTGNGKSITYGYQLQNIAGVTNINVTLALHKSHFIEFTAKPTKAAAP